MAAEHSITDDPIFYITIVIFALLTTALPAGLNQTRFLPILQTVSLMAFLIMVLRQSQPRRAVRVLAIWLPVQFIVVLLFSWILPGVAERTIADGFQRSAAILEWFYTADPLPESIVTQPWARLLEMVTVLVGSLLTVWTLARATNVTGFLAGALGNSLDSPVAFVAALPVWSLLRLAGYAGFIAVLAEPLWTGNWSPAFYWHKRRRLLLTAATLLLLGLALELALPSLWRSLFRGFVVPAG